MSTLSRMVVGLAGLTATVAMATTPNTISEPGMIELLAAGAVVGLVVWVRNRRK